MRRGRSGSLAWLLAALASACVGPTVERRAGAPAPTQPPDFPYHELDRTNAVTSAPKPDTSCPVPPRVDSAYDLAGLSLFSRTLFYVRENHPQDVSPRARELLVGALEAVASQDSEVLVERDREAPPRWVTVTVSGQQCALNIERVDAPWSLRSRLQDAARFIEGHLPPGPPEDRGQRLMKIEIAATNGMLSALDRHSRLLDAQTYRQVRPFVGLKPSGPENSMDATGAPGMPMRAALPRLTSGPTVAHLRLQGFPTGVSGEVERALATLESVPQKGIVLDLRDNSGGLLDEAVKVADAFIKAGSLGAIASKRERKDLVAQDGGHEPRGALVVLVNRQTASGSELVAAAIKNLGRGVVLGEPTAGAALVRVFFDMPMKWRRPPSKDRDVVQDVLGGAKPSPAVEEKKDDPLGLVLTTGRLLAAGGAEIEGAGVQPDVQSPWSASGPSSADADCLRQFADALIRQARDPQRATLLSTAKALAPQAMCRPVAPPRP